MPSRLLPRALHLALAAAALGVAPSLAVADTCPTSTLIVGGSSEQIAGPSASGTRPGGGFGSATFYFSDYGDSVRLTYAYEGYAELVVRGRYRFLGATPGTPLSNQVQMHVQAYLFGAGGDPYCNETWAAVELQQDQTVMAQGVWYNHAGDPYCGGGGTTTFSFTCSHPADTEFEIAERLRLYTTVGYQQGQAMGKLAFGALPPGAFMVRCDGDTTVQVTAVGAEVATTLRIDDIRPNPARGGFRASLSLPAGGPTFVRLLDVSGRAVETQVVNSTSGVRRELSFGGSLPPGCYFLHVRRGAVTAVREVVIRR